MAREDTKKSIFKKWWFWVIVIVIAIGIGSSTGGETEDVASDTSNDSEQNEATSNDKDTNKESAEEESENTASEEGTISSDEFEQISNGMTYDEVVEIIGSEGSVQSETGEKDTEFHTIIYSWDGDAGWGANAMLTFQGGKLVSKAQAGVGGETKSDVTITIDEFNQLENGMSTEEVFRIIGGEGELTSESGDKGSQFHTVTYTYYGESGMGSNAILMFQGDKLNSKSQFGLE